MHMFNSCDTLKTNVLSNKSKSALQTVTTVGLHDQLDVIYLSRSCSAICRYSFLIIFLKLLYVY